MSKQVVSKLEILNANDVTLHKSVGNMIEHLNAKLLNQKSFKIWNNVGIDVKGICLSIPGNLYPIDIYIEDGKVCLNGDEMDMARTQGLIKQFYGATFAQQRMMMKMQQRVPMEYNKQTKRLRLQVGV